jgi:hypothetical protein
VHPADGARLRALGVDISGLGDDPLAEMRIFEGAVSAVDIDERLRDVVAAGVSSIVTSTAHCDVFDVVELLRLRELPISPVLALQPGFDGSGAVVELVAVALLSRGWRAPSSGSDNDLQPHQLIEDLHVTAKRLLRIASYRHLFVQQAAGGGRFARLAAEYQGFFAQVRSHQYDSVAAEHDGALFDRPDTNGILAEHLGFSYGEFLTVRETIASTYSSAMNGIRDRTADFVLRAEEKPPTDEAEIQSFVQDMTDMMFLPGTRASFTAQAVAKAAELPSATVEAVLRTFSTDFDASVDPVDAVLKFLRGRNPLRSASLLRDGSDYIMTGGPIGDDSFRPAAEAALKETSSWTRYDKKIRSTVTEQIGAAALQRLLRSAPLSAPVKYVAPKDGEEAGTVGHGCDDPVRSGDLVEGDALFVIDDVAVCLEVKGGSIPDAARRGDLTRLERETKKILGKGAGQARRLEALIRVNGGIWLDDATWLDLSGVREIHTIVAGLDTFGPLSVALGDLASAELLGDGKVPWIASLHDLEVISRTIDRPAEFLLYLRRRTEAAIADNYRGVDELDLFMLFMHGELYVEPDPAEIHRAHPRTPPPSSRDRRRHVEDARPTFVGTFTGDLDRWMYSVEGTNPFEAPKPTFNSNPAADDLVNLLEAEQAPGWLRCGADLLALSGKTQKRLGDAIDQLVDTTQVDDRWHDLCQGYAGNFGYPTFFAACAPSSMGREEAVARLQLYMQAKKHQLRSDRSLGFLFDHRRNVVAGLYLNNLPTDDAELDEVGRRIGLSQTWKRGATSKAANKAKRQRRKAKKRRRRS